MHATADFTTFYTPEPLQLSGALDKFTSFDVTPCIGTEFQDVDLSDWITCSDSDALLRDLAILGKISLQLKKSPAFGIKLTDTGGKQYASEV